jgi:hypothetical protein
MRFVAFSTRLERGIGPVLRLLTCSLKGSSRTEVTEDKDVSDEVVLSTEEV